MHRVFLAEPATGDPFEGVDQFVEGQDVFVITAQRGGPQASRVLFATSIEAILPAEGGDRILADGLRFRPDADGVFTTLSGGRTLVLAAPSDETLARAKAHGAALREARKARQAEAARRAETIRAAANAVNRAQLELASVERKKPWNENDLKRAKGMVADAQARVDAHPGNLAQAQSKLKQAEQALATAQAENG